MSAEQEPDDKNIDFRQQPERYRIGRGEQGVLSVEPYKSEILPHWRFKTVDEAHVSAAKIYALYLDYKQAGDFVGMDMARKFLQMGYTRARRYANHPSGRKYAPTPASQAGLPSDKPPRRQLLPQAADWATGEKAQAAQVFHGFYEKVIADADYQQRAEDHRTRFEK